MTKEAVNSENPRDALKLKLPEPAVSAKTPWEDDALDRAQIADKLTNLIRDQRDPFVISIDGQWGTGKTFLLKRWQKALENEDFRVIYFNAWEDDFCDDPLLSIIGQLSEYFKKGKLKEIAGKIGETAILLLKNNMLSVIEKATGIKLEVDLNNRDLLQEYLNQRVTKDCLKEHLKELSAEVVKETNHPLVFIIDELDRCRPTFAIELLERVKHIFDVPDLVFVFGVNRDELCKSLTSIYGEIDASVYLRRFFDMEFMLPEVDSEQFCRSLMDKFRIKEFFHTLSTGAYAEIHRPDYNDLSRSFPILCSRLALSLRDIDYCVRLVALVGKNLQDSHTLYPGLLSLLIPLKFKNPTLYRQFIRGECHASDVMNYLDGMISGPIEDSRLAVRLDAREADLYLAESKHLEDTRAATPLQQLRLLREGTELTDAHLLSQRTKTSDPVRIINLLSRMESYYRAVFPNRVLDYLTGLIDIHSFVRR